MSRLTCSLLLALLLSGEALGQDMPLSDVLIDGESWQVAAKGFQYVEALAVDAGGALYFSDVTTKRIHKLGADGQVSVFVEDSGGAVGLKFGPDGRLFACQSESQRIVAFDSAGKSTTFAEGIQARQLVINRHGHMYVSEPEKHSVWFVSAKGEKKLVERCLNYPNGLALWAGQGTLVVADARAPFLWTYRIGEDGQLMDKSHYYTCQLEPLTIQSGADGLVVDKVGRLYATSALGLQMFDPTGRLGGAITSPQRNWISGVAFGADLQTLYVASVDKIFRRKMKASGIDYFAPPAKK